MQYILIFENKMIYIYFKNYTYFINDTYWSLEMNGPYTYRSFTRAISKNKNRNLVLQYCQVSLTYANILLAHTKIDVTHNKYIIVVSKQRRRDLIYSVARSLPTGIIFSYFKTSSRNF